MAPIKIDRVSKLASLDLHGISLYLKELLFKTTSDGVIFYASDIRSIIGAINDIEHDINAIKKSGSYNSKLST